MSSGVTRALAWKVLGALCAAALLAQALLPAESRAHSGGQSYSTWEIQGRVARVQLRIRAVDLSRLAGSAHGDIQAYLSEHLTLQTGSGLGDCAVSETVSRAAARGWQIFEWTLRCPGAGSLWIRSDLLAESAPNHLHFATVLRDGTRSAEHVLTEGSRVWALPGLDASADTGNAAAGPRIGAYLRLGIEHILSGWDHIAFVLALVLIATSLGQVAALVTGFTVAHSVTLAVGVLGLVRPEPSAVEALIGLSIVLVAVENSWRIGGRGVVLPALIAGALLVLALLALAGIGSVPALALAGLALFTACYFLLLRARREELRLRAAIAFTFGLVHGFGFAGVLSELSLRPGELAPALFGFNLGVELGQLACLALAWPLLRWLRRTSASAHQLFIETSSGAVAALGTFWFLTRTLA